MECDCDCSFYITGFIILAVILIVISIWFIITSCIRIHRFCSHPCTDLDEICNNIHVIIEAMFEVLVDKSLLQVLNSIRMSSKRRLRTIVQYLRVSTHRPANSSKSLRSLLLLEEISFIAGDCRAVGRCKTLELTECQIYLRNPLKRLIEFGSSSSKGGECFCTILIRQWSGR